VCKGKNHSFFKHIFIPLALSKLSNGYLIVEAIDYSVFSCFSVNYRRMSGNIVEIGMRINLQQVVFDLKVVLCTLKIKNRGGRIDILVCVPYVTKTFIFQPLGCKKF